MTYLAIPPMLGKLTHDVIILCSKDKIIQEANPFALRMIGPDIVGKSLESLFSDMSGSKVHSFIEHMSQFDMGEISETWELFFDTPEDEPRPINIRGGVMDTGEWLLVGTCEPPQLTTIYYEVLAINSELTNLVRRLSKDLAMLNSRLARLLQEQE